MLPSRLLAKAIRCPSGDHAGLPFVDPLVSCISPEPSGLIVKTLPPSPNATLPLSPGNVASARSGTVSATSVQIRATLLTARFLTTIPPPDQRAYREGRAR